MDALTRFVDLVRRPKMLAASFAFMAIPCLVTIWLFGRLDSELVEHVIATDQTKGRPRNEHANDSYKETELADDYRVYPDRRNPGQRAAVLVPADGPAVGADGPVAGDAGGAVSATDAPEPPPPSLYAAGSLQELACSYDWDCGIVSCIIRRESNWDPNAYNPASGTSGLMQIRPSAHAARIAALGYTIDQLFDPAVNLAVGYDIYRDHQGWDAWDGSPGCWS